MGRASVLGNEVRELQKALATLFLKCGSVNKLCSFLNGLLAANKVGQKIYPNRLHALLSSDTLRAVNAKTLSLVQKAVGISDWEVQPVDSEASAKIVADVNHEWEISAKTRGEIQRISSELSMPAAVVEFILLKSGVIQDPSTEIIGSEPTLAGDIAPSFSHRTNAPPNYDFQGVAIKQCRAALRKGIGRRVGLVSPTGSGKTEMALQIALEMLHESPRKSTKVFWITHRKNLKTQAHQRLQKILLRGVKGIPEEASSLLADRVEFLMVREAGARIQNECENVELIIIDEAHHAAAGSYDPIFEPLPPLPVLALTATPNRTDGLAIRIDEIGFTITFAELVERNVILMPEFIPFPVTQFDWTTQEVEDLADHLISNTNDKYLKVLVIAPQIERVEEFHQALLKRLAEEDGHTLNADDIGFIHSQANSGHQDSQTFINAFSLKPRGILVSAQMLLEGFDDPQIDTVVITYATTSLITLMQAAGRCVRRAHGKSFAYVIQAKDDRASYYFEQRWLYQDISDFARPQLINIVYRNEEELKAQFSEQLVAHNVSEINKARILASLKQQLPGETSRLLLAGLPYYGSAEGFNTMATWTGILLTNTNRGAVTTAFNEFCSRGRLLAQVQHLEPIVNEIARRFNLGADEAGKYLQVFLHNLFISTQNAVREVYGHDSNNYHPGGRPKPQNHSTSWLKYITFEFRPTIPEVVSNFLADCINRTEIFATIEKGASISMLLRVPLPLAGFEAYALTDEQTKTFLALKDELISQLRTAPGIQKVASAAAFLALQESPEIPRRIWRWMDQFSRIDFMAVNSLSLPAATTIKQ